MQSDGSLAELPGLAGRPPSSVQQLLNTTQTGQNCYCPNHVSIYCPLCLYRIALQPGYPGNSHLAASVSLTTARPSLTRPGPTLPQSTLAPVQVATNTWPLPDWPKNFRVGSTAEL